MTVWRRGWESASGHVSSSTLAAFGAMIKRDLARWRKVAAETGIRL
jgi:hypothetical protein